MSLISVTTSRGFFGFFSLGTFDLLTGQKMFLLIMVHLDSLSTAVLVNNENDASFRALFRVFSFFSCLASFPMTAFVFMELLFG